VSRDGGINQETSAWAIIMKEVPVELKGPYADEEEDEE
jgi:hypothetical protein